MGDLLLLEASLGAMDHREWGLPQEPVSSIFALCGLYADMKQLHQELALHQACNRITSRQAVPAAFPRVFNHQPICPTSTLTHLSFVLEPLGHRNQPSHPETLADESLTLDLHDQAWAPDKEWMLIGKLYERA